MYALFKQTQPSLDYEPEKYELLLYRVTEEKIEQYLGNNPALLANHDSIIITKVVDYSIETHSLFTTMAEDIRDNVIDVSLTIAE